MALYFDILTVNPNETQADTDPIAHTFSKAEIEEKVRCYINDHLESMDSAMLYVHLKELEYAVKTAIEALKDQAFDSAGQYLEGATSGKVNGHSIAISYPNEWHYTKAVEALKERQKKELAKYQAEERESGTAKQLPGKGRITITLREG